MKSKRFTSGEDIKEHYELTCDVTMKNGASIVIEETAILDVRDLLHFDGDALIRDGARLVGRNISVGHKFYMDHHAEIGGGSCFDKDSRLVIGNHFHLGSFAMINTARLVTIGDEVGMGRFSNIYTHGAYLNVLEGFPEQWGPVKIGNNVWLPNATVMPGITIGDNTVVAAGSIVTKDIEGGGLWAGTPAKRIDKVTYPNPMSKEEKKKYIMSLETDDPEVLRRHGIRKSIDNYLE